jgi:integrase
MELYKQTGSKYWTADFIVDGKRVRKSTRQTTRAKAGEVASEFLRQVQKGEAPIHKSRTPTLRQFAEKHFLPFVEGNSTASTTKDYYRLGWQDLANQPLADQQLDAIRKPHVEVIQIAGSNSTHNRGLRTLRRIFNVAFELDILPKVPKFSLLEEEGRSQLITTDIETRMAAQMAKSKRKGSLRIALYIILDCGLRPKEIASLSIPDVCLVTGTVRVIRANTKSKAGVRLVAMTQRVKELLQAQIGARKTGWVFPSPRYPGHPIKRQALTVAWRKAADKAGIDPDVDLYCARHTFGTDVMKATKDPFLTKLLMGHSDLKTTERYQHPELNHVGGLMDARNHARSMS